MMLGAARSIRAGLGVSTGFVGISVGISVEEPVGISVGISVEESVGISVGEYVVGWG